MLRKIANGLGCVQSKATFPRGSPPRHHDDSHARPATDFRRKPPSHAILPRAPAQFGTSPCQLAGFLLQSKLRALIGANFVDASGNVPSRWGATVPLHINGILIDCEAVGGRPPVKRNRASSASTTLFT